MNLQRDSVWRRRGCSLLWDSAALSTVATPSDVLSLREFFALADDWPESLPGAGGDALIVAGVEGCLDVLSVDDVTVWLETDLKRAVLAFQDHYGGQAALILWLPSGRKRIGMATATEEYFWGSATGTERRLPIGRCLWAGAESDVARILISDTAQPNPDGDAWVGLYHPRIS